MKLTASDLDASIHSSDRAPLRIVRMRNGNDERIVLTEPGALDELPPLDVPQATEHEYHGMHFKTPPPRRSMWQEEAESPWLVRLYGWGFISGIGVSALFVKCSQ